MTKIHTMGRRTVGIKDAKSRNSRSGTIYGYSVEARLNYHTPKSIGGMVLDNRWQEVQWKDWPFPGGIPRPRFEHSEVRGSGLLGYNEAEALRWLFICIADADSTPGSLCIETRIISHKVDYSVKATPHRIIESIDSRGNLTEDLPQTEDEV